MLENNNASVNVELAAPQTDANVTSEVAEKPAENVANSQQSAEDNAKFADRRRKQEIENYRKQLNDANTKLAEFEQLKTALKGTGFSGSTVDIADQIAAQTQGVTIEEIRTAREQKEQAAIVAKERDMYKEQLNNYLITQDIQKIKEKYPDIETIEDLPDGFIKIMATGAVKDPVTAYELLKPQKEVPASTGSVQSTEKQTQDFFTREEVMKMNKVQVKENYEKIRKSMNKW